MASASVHGGSAFSAIACRTLSRTRETLPTAPPGRSRVWRRPVLAAGISGSADYAAASSSASLRRSREAETFFSRWVTLDVPGMGRMTSERCSSQDSATLDGVESCAAAM